MSRGHCVVGAIFHVHRTDNTAEFDPFFIERIKNCLTLMVEKDLVRQLELEISLKHTFKNAKIAQQYVDKLQEADDAEDSEENNDIVDLNNNGYGAVRSPLKRGKPLDEEEKLLTSRGNPRESVGDPKTSVATGFQRNRSIRKPDFIRQSLLSARKSLS